MMPLQASQINYELGHFLTWNEKTNHYFLQWKPLPNIYSPPRLIHGMKFKKIKYNENIPINLIIGKEGKYFKWISSKANVPYIFYREEEKSIEFWGLKEDSINFAIWLFYNHLTHWKLKFKNQSSFIMNH